MKLKGEKGKTGAQIESILDGLVTIAAGSASTAFVTRSDRHP